MGRRSGAGAARSVAAVGRRIEHWRRVRVKRSPMPEDLWQAATELAQVHGTSAVARELGLGYDGLRDRVEGGMAKRAKPAVPTKGFVEVDGAGLLGVGRSPGTVVELWDGDNRAKLLIRLGEREGLDVVGLAEAFWRRRS
jgi:hypothetical protein